MRPNEELCWMPALELASAIKGKEISPREVTEAVLQRIDRVNPELNAYCTISADLARRGAQKAEEAVMRGDALGPLHGVPFSVKDLLITKGVRTTFGSKTSSENVPSEDTPAVERMKRAGGIMLGKTNTSSFGWLGVTHNALFGATHNPWRAELTPGGSSGGCGAAVASGLSPISVGADGGGSIRIPASFCGIFGLKPSFGLIPVYPLSGAWSLSHYGPLTRTVSDAALMLNIMAGPDDRDPHSLPAQGIDYLKELNKGCQGLRVAWSADLGYGSVDPEIKNICEKAAKRFKDFGCIVEEANPGWPDPHDIWATIFHGGAAVRLKQIFMERRQDLDPGLDSFIEEGLRWTAAKYIEAWLKRFDFWAAVGNFFSRYDLLLTPAVACPPFRVGLPGPEKLAGKKISGRYDWLFLTYPFNLTGQPAASVPCGFTSGRLPVGLQIVGRRFTDVTVLKAAASLELTNPRISIRPPIV